MSESICSQMLEENSELDDIQTCCTEFLNLFELSDSDNCFFCFFLMKLKSVSLAFDPERSIICASCFSNLMKNRGGSRERE